jgi:hypothetical protein
MSKSKGWEGDMAGTGNMRNAYKFSRKEKTCRGTFKLIVKNVKNWIHVIQHRNQWWAPLRMAINCWVTRNLTILLNIYDDPCSYKTFMTIFSFSFISSGSCCYCGGGGATSSSEASKSREQELRTECVIQKKRHSIPGTYFIIIK